MNVRELREALEALERDGKGDMDVMSTYNYGDYWHTTVAARIDGTAEETVKYSQYHQMDKLVDYDAEEDTSARGSEFRQVIIIS
jgi:hypothetical protein